MNSNNISEKTINVKTGSGYIDERILKFVINEGADFTLKSVVITVKAIKEVVRNQKVTIFTDARSFFNVSHSGMKFITSEANSNTLAVAFLVKDLSSRLKIHNLINTYKPIIPFKYFVNEDEALNWLKYLSGENDGFNDVNPSHLS